MQRRLSHRGKQVEIPVVMHEVGKELVQYRGPVILNFLNRIVNLNSIETSKKDHFKRMLSIFSFKAPMIVKKSDNFIYS